MTGLHFWCLATISQTQRDADLEAQRADTRLLFLPLVRLSVHSERRPLHHAPSTMPNHP
jgi:hypothetical protein